MEPIPAKPWKGVWNATVPGSMCLQWVRIHPPNYGVQSHLVGDEDCLFLNVYTPKLPGGGTPPNLEVFVYIHGGAFMYGWGHEYGAKIMMDQDAVLVTINYRVGPLGFLTTGDEIVPGNNGLKDQATALKWVKNNIGAFGGNPNSITISGTSAGGASVSYHYLSSWSRGLFNRGISQSGSSFCGWAQMEEGVAKSRRLGALLGCHGPSSKELVDCLRTRPARKIVQQMEHFIVWMYNPYSPFAPTIEKAGPNPFLNKHPVDVILGNEAYDVPWMASATLEDGLYPAADWVGNETTLETLDRRFVELSPHIFHYNFTVAEDRKQEVVDRLREHYLRCRPITSKTIKEVIEMCTDRLFLLPVVRTAKLLAAVNKSPVYFYMFGYRGKHSFSEVMSGTSHNFGVSHLDDTGYLMDYDFKTDETDEDQEMSKVLLDLWMTYAKTGKPMPAGRNFEWHPTEPNKKDLSYLQIMSPTEMDMMKSDDIGNQKFWDSLPISEPQMRKTTPLKGNTEMVHINIGSIFRRSRRSETSQNQEKDDKRETRPQVALAVQHFLINIGLGMSMGHSAVLLPQLKEEADSGLQVDEETGSWIASVYMLVSPLGCFLGGVLLEKIGRRSGVLLGQGVYIVGWTVIAAAQNSTMMICGRILDGIAVGIIGSAAAILFDEMAHPRLRVTVLCLASSFLSSGTLVMSSIGSFLHWRTAAALAAVPSIIHIVIVAFLVYETPVYFVKKGKMKEAEKALYWLWGQRKIKVKQELENLATRLQKHETEDKSDDHQQGGCWKILKNKEQYFEAYILKSFLIIHIFNLLQIPGGMGLITLYTVDILNAVQGSVQVVDGNVATIVISAVKVVFLLLSSYLLYRVGRRPMAVISGIGSALPALATAAILYCQSGRILDLDHGTLAWLNFVLVLLYVASNTLGFYCLTYTMIGELLPAKVRGFLFGYIMALNYLVGGGFAKAYPLMLRAMGMEGLFLMFGLSCLLCTLFVFLLLPETLGRTLEEIEDYFHQPNIMWISRKRNDGDVS